MVSHQSDAALKQVNRGDIIFRPFRTDDLSELREMVFSLYREDSAGEPITEDKVRATVKMLSRFPERSFPKRGFRERGSIVLFETQQQRVGYAILIYYWSNEYGGELVAIDELYVKPDWRNRSISTLFIHDLRSGADPRIKGVQLEVTPRNKRALAYYKRLGFKECENIHLFSQIVAAEPDRE